MFVKRKTLMKTDGLTTRKELTRKEKPSAN